MNLLVTFYADQDQYENEDENRKKFKHLTWSPYDRIIFKEVNSFEELCVDNYKGELLQSKEKSEVSEENKEMTYWNGIKQCMHLIEEMSNLKGDWEIQPYNEQYVFKSGEKKYIFHCIYAMRFSEKIQKLIYNGMVFDKELIRKEIFNCIKAECDEIESIDFKCFRSLGCEDMVVIFLTNSLRDVISVINCINKTTIELPNEVKEKEDKYNEVFSSTCVFLGLNDQAYDGMIDIDLIVNLNLKRNNPTYVLNEIDAHIETKYTHYNVFRGISAIKLVIPKGNISFKEFHNSIGIFNGSSKFYIENIHSSRTYFVIPDENIEIKARNIDLTNIYGLSLCKTEEIPYPNTKLSPVADFIFGEYCRLFSSQRVIQWRSILKAQYLATKSFAEYYHKVDKFEACKLLNYMQSSLQLINQACSPVSEIPNHNHFYSSSFHDLLKAYYGIIDLIFNIGYNIPHAENTKQDPITFAICLNATARINSKMFTRTDIKNRLVVFFLPYDSFWNYSDNIKKLVHEVFHYIAPYDRDVRAKWLVDIIYSMILHNIATESCNDISKQKKIEIAPSINKWCKYIIEIFNDEKRKNVFYNELKSKCPEFFLLAAPEWQHRYIDRGEIYYIIYFISNQVKRDFESSFDKAMKYIVKYKPTENANIDKEFFSNTILPKIKNVSVCEDATSIGSDERFIIDTNYVRQIKIYMNATKEAFCDLWALHITHMSIPEFITFLFRTMQEYYPKEIILNSLSKHANNETIINIQSTVFRIILLIYKHLNDTKQSMDTKNITFKGLFKDLYSSNCDDDVFITTCIEIIEKKYAEFVLTIGKNETENLCKMAFHMVDDICCNIEKYEKNHCFEILQQISETDLSNSINISDIDILCNFIGSKKYNDSYNTINIQTTNSYYRNIDNDSYQRIVCNTGELMDSIESISKNIALNSDTKQRHILWYRGVCSDKYDLLPSIFRNGNRKLSIYANQAQIIKNAYFHSPYAVDVWNMPIEQRTACLQHYGVPTNLLDFSLNPLVALHFSINPDRKSDIMQIKNGEFQPVIYVFDPINYNRAIKRMLEGQPNLDVPDTISSVTFDINQNEEERSRYFVDDMSYDFIYEHNYKHNKIYVPSIRKDFYPVPMVIQQSNPRIVTQSGTFVVYSLHAKPQTLETLNRYNYLDLLNIQSRYIEFLHDSTNFNDKFIFPIYLRKNFIPELQEQLKHLNIKTKTFYPELNRIFEDAMSDMI